MEGVGKKLSPRCEDKCTKLVNAKAISLVQALTVAYSLLSVCRSVCMPGWYGCIHLCLCIPACLSTNMSFNQSFVCLSVCACGTLQRLHRSAREGDNSEGTCTWSSYWYMITLQANSYSVLSCKQTWVSIVIATLKPSRVCIIGLLLLAGQPQRLLQFPLLFIICTDTLQSLKLARGSTNVTPISTSEHQDDADRHAHVPSRDTFVGGRGRGIPVGQGGGGDRSTAGQITGGVD